MTEGEKLLTEYEEAVVKAATQCLLDAQKSGSNSLVPSRSELAEKLTMRAHGIRLQLVALLASRAERGVLSGSGDER